MTDFSKDGWATNIYANEYDQLQAGESVVITKERPLMGENKENGPAFVQLFSGDTFLVESVRKGGSDEVRPDNLKVRVVNFKSEQRGVGRVRIHREWICVLQKA